MFCIDVVVLSSRFFIPAVDMTAVVYVVVTVSVGVTVTKGFEVAVVVLVAMSVDVVVVKTVVRTVIFVLGAVILKTDLSHKRREGLGESYVEVALAAVLVVDELQYDCAG